VTAVLLPLISARLGHIARICGQWMIAGLDRDPPLAGSSAGRARMK